MHFWEAHACALDRLLAQGLCRACHQPLALELGMQRFECLKRVHEGLVDHGVWVVSPICVGR